MLRFISETGVRWRALLYDLLFPRRCVGCRAVGSSFCASCLAAIVAFDPPHCPRCGLTALRNGSLCRACSQQHHPKLDGLRSLGPHVAPLRQAIHALKYKGQVELAEPLGALLADQWLDHATVALDGLIPMPLHPTRLRERGYNQSDLLARALAPRLALPVRSELLWRTRSTPPQVGLGGEERRKNVQEAFDATPEVAGGRWLLVDDVCTTGSTLDASASALRDRGAVSVWAITLAHA